MCEFFSFSTMGNYQPLFFNAEQRKALGKDNPKDLKPDSHASICFFYVVSEDKANKYEYDPLTKVFTVDQLNNPHDDSEGMEAWVKSLDFKTIIPELVVKPIINPTKVKRSSKTVTKQELKWFNEWIEINKKCNSVWNSVCNSVRDSVRDSVGNSVGDSVRDSVWNSVCNSVWNSVRDSVWNSVWNSVWDSLWNSVWAYMSSFFDIKYDYDFSCCSKLWERGLVPSFDGKTWRLHSFKNGKAITVHEVIMK